MNQSVFISSGNRKMSLPVFNLPAVSTCPGCTKACVAKCYARKAERAYPQVLPCRKRNREASSHDGFVSGVVDVIKAKGKKYFRIHESGDFYSQEYLNKWFAIARALPKVKFLAFTKSFHLDFSDVPANMTVIWSVWPDSVNVPAGRKAYAGDCGHDSTFECKGNCDRCKQCWNGTKDIHFEIH